MATGKAIQTLTLSDLVVPMLQAWALVSEGTLIEKNQGVGACYV